ncbi:MAG: hypothetical protein LC731_01350 [Acidobacteria bacterium]|nr:hypothetical protein [Acidobacteriota bacterium]
MMTATALLLLPACSGRTSTSNALAQNGTAQTVKPKTIKTSELAKLRWIEGTWRGTGDVDKPFFERYYFENDSTLVVESYTDETLSKVSDVTKFELKDGQFGNGGEGARWAATELDDNAVTFSPIARARNTFRWQRESKDLWKAVLDWPAADGKPARQRVYRMERYSYTKGSTP